MLVTDCWADISIQSATSKDARKQGWAEADLAGYRHLQDSAQTYGRNYFCKFRCHSLGIVLTL